LQIERPLSRQDFAKLIHKTLGLKLPTGVMDVLMAVFGDEQGCLDGSEFVQVMKRRNKVPGYKVSE
jgi:Ca2+-binding EF-hand superfamily protein